MYIQLSELERDIFREIISIGVGKAADAFAQMTHTKAAVILSVPRLQFIQPENFEEEFRPFYHSELTIRTQLKGEIKGLTLLFFSPEKIDWILNNVLTERDLLSTTQESLKLSLLLELSNILSGALVTQLSNMIGLRVVGLPPESIEADPTLSIEGLICQAPPCQPILLSIKTNLKDLRSSVELPLLLVLEVSSLTAILSVIRQKDPATLWLRDHLN